jgi:hypothetical protein
LGEAASLNARAIWGSLLQETAAFVRRASFFVVPKLKNIYNDFDKADKSIS